MTLVPQSMGPAELAFGARRKVFNLRKALATNWYAGSAFKTAWFNAMSLLFPLGEKFFIDSVCHYNDQIEDPKLLTEIEGFQAQEATHRLQHQKYNEMLCQLREYDLDRFEKNERERIAWTYRELTARRRLAGTTANEHLTAIMAHDLLTHENSMAGADPLVVELWRWHAIEETEHKGVAYDVYIAVGGTVSERRQAQLFSTFFFFKDTLRNLCIMLQHEGRLWSPLEWLSGFWFLFVKPGIIRRTFIPWLRYFKKTFHPWQNDNRYLIDEWEQQ